MDRIRRLLRPSVLVLALVLAGAVPSAAAASDADLSVSVTSSPEPVADQSAVTYTVTATNAGPDDTYAIVYDNVPDSFSYMSFGGDAAVNCTPAEPGLATQVSCDPHLAPHETKTLTVTAQTYQCVTGATDDAGIDINSPDRTDPNPANNRAQVTSTMTSTDGSACEPASGGGNGARPGAGGGGGGVSTPLTINHLVLGVGSFRGASSGPSLVAAKATGTQVTYRLSKAATAKFYVRQRLPGRRAKGKCVRPTKANRKSRACTRLVPMRGSFAQAGAAGANRFRFTGCLAGRKLRPGKYQLVGYAVDAGAGETSAPARASFSIVR